MGTRLVRFAVGCAMLAVLVGCAGMGRGKGPVDAFVFQAGVNKALTQDVKGAIDERVEPKEIRLVVPVGTDMRALMATLSLSKEAVVTVVSTGTPVVQKNGETANDFSVPVTYSVAVTGEKKPWTYRVFVREAETLARLSAIVVPQGTTLQPGFSPTVHDYTLDVPFATAKVRIEARGQTATMKSVTVDGAETAGPTGAVIVEFARPAQERPVKIETLAEDGVTREQYTVTIRRGAPDTNSFLAVLDLQDYPIAPDFAPARLAYQVTVPYETAKITLHARPQSTVASIALDSAPVAIGGRTTTPVLKVTGNPASSGGAQVDFSTGDVLGIIIAVTAEDQSVRQYVVTVLRTPPDPNNFLADLSLTVGGTEVALAPAFAPGRFLYVTQVPYATAQVTVLATPQSRVAGAALEIPPAPAGGRAPAVKGTVQAKPGATVDFAAPLTRLVLSVAVTAQDGGVLRYTLDLRRAEPDRNPDLASLTVSAGTLVPVFTPRIVSYNLALPAAADSVEIKAAAASPVATIAVAEQPNVKPAAAQSLTLAVAAGSSATVTFVVSAEDGTQKLYMVRISRASAPAALDGNSLLQSLVVSGAQLTPAFDASVAQYDARLAANVESVTVTAAAQSQLASVSIDGQAAAKTGRTIAVAAGSTKTVFIDVTAQNGAVTRYSLRLTREAAKPPEGGQTGGGTTAPPPAGAGPDHVIVTAKNLRLQTREAAALTAAGDTVGTEVRITVRYYRTNDVITQYTAAVDVKQQANVPSLTFSSPSAGLTLDRSRMIEVEIAVATTKGRFLFYTEAQPADDQVSIEVPFLLYGPSPQVHWPAVGSAVQLAGYVSRLPLSKARAMDAEDFGKDAKGEYAISVQILDAGTGAAIGTATVSTKPGQGRSRTLSFASGLTAPEGTTVKYVLSARAKNGKVWSATGTTAVWTTTMRYPAGFEPVLILVEDDLAPEK